ncbi:MAG: acetyl-CoA carboxylase biotin carboxyl carrier protein [Bacteroidota bacterium]
MDLSVVKKLIKLVSESTIDEVEIEEEGRKIRVAKTRFAGAPPPMHYAPPGSGVYAPLPAPPAQLPAKEQAAEPPAANLHEVKSPIVGTFYRAPAPDAAPYVEPGAVVHPGMILCIVEAMKLMNEIECDVAGKVVKVFVENGQPVEYDQPLFLIEKS